MTLQITQVDAFTTRPFAGNPAAVCVLPSPRDERWMQAVAMEMNLSETAFLVKRNGHYELRWFTPGAEVELCGHATLASAHVLWDQGHLQPDDQAIFETRSGRLTAWQSEGWIQMDFPARPVRVCEPPDGLLQSLGLHEAVECGQAKWNHLIRVQSEQIVRQLEPDFNALLHTIPHGVIVTAESDSDQFDFVSRYFAPRYKVNEDPVTGSAHCALACFWAERLGKNTFTAYQASRRGGVVKVSVNGDRVQLGGQAVTVMRANLTSIACE